MIDGFWRIRILIMNKTIDESDNERIRFVSERAADRLASTEFPANDSHVSSLDGEHRELRRQLVLSRAFAGLRLHRDR